MTLKLPVLLLPSPLLLETHCSVPQHPRVQPGFTGGKWRNADGSEGREDTCVCCRVKAPQQMLRAGEGWLRSGGCDKLLHKPPNSRIKSSQFFKKIPTGKPESVPIPLAFPGSRQPSPPLLALRALACKSRQSGWLKGPGVNAWTRSIKLFMTQ